MTPSIDLSRSTCNRCLMTARLCIHCELKALRATLRESVRLIESGKGDKAVARIREVLK